MWNLNFQKYLDMAIELTIGYVPKVFLALLTLVVGFLIVGFVIKMMKKAMTANKVEPSLKGFLESLVATVLKVLVLITVAAMLGVQMTSFVAILGAAGLAVGLALQGSLANFAGGVLILFFKPFKVGDLIKAEGYLGKVESILIFSTVLKTLDNKTVIIPNGKLSNGAIMNYSVEEKLRVDMTFGVGYEDDFEKAKTILEKIIANNAMILKEPKPLIAVGELADSSVNIICRVWTEKDNYWIVNFAMNEAVKKEFDKHSLTIPYPQRDIHLHQVN